MTSSDEASVAADTFPTAEVRSSSSRASAAILQSSMWWITLLCFLLAVGLAWQSRRPHGIEIVIDFPEGHGLKAGDSLRHRGIDIGLVTELKLAADLHGVQTKVELERSAAAIAREGSQFWIVRPQLSLTNVSGLETAVGAKYIAVHPGDIQGAEQREFAGRKTPPAVSMEEDGVEIVLRGQESFGINPGSPVTYRGIRVGQIHAVELGSDALSVLVSATILRDYQPLLRRGSKFWKTSGVDVDFGLKGFHMSTESLATMARGGVSFVTPESSNEQDMLPVENGHEYDLAEQMETQWLRKAAAIEFALPSP